MTDHLNVYLDGILAGRLAQASGGALSFSYDDLFLTRRVPTPLSLSMPLSGSRHSNRVVAAWLEGLLPDNLGVREEWGRRFEVSPRNPFALLRHVGRDAAGAVQVLPADVDPPDAAQRTGKVRRLSHREVNDLLVGLTVRDAGWEVGAGAAAGASPASRTRWRCIASMMVTGASLRTRPRRPTSSSQRVRRRASRTCT